MLAYLLAVPSFTLAASPSTAASLLPESLAARSEQAAQQKTVSVFLKEDDPLKLTELLNTSNEEYAQKGWSVLTITSYMRNGDVDGLFVTYHKGLAVK